jgi:HlyD family secretion protein
MTRSLALVLLIASAARCFSGQSAEAPVADLRLRRGDLRTDMVISGEIEAARGDFLNVPSFPSRQTAIKWIVEDGATVAKGDRIAELDNSALTADLESKRQGAMQAVQELQQREAEWAADVQQKQLDVATRHAAVEKARIEALVPRDIISGRAWEEKQSALRRATVEYEKAADVLASRRIAIDADRRNLQLQIAKADREITIAEDAIAELVLRAPGPGIVVIRDHPWEGRKLQVGDLVWVGFPIAMLPDLTSLQVKASLADVDDGKIARSMPVTVTLDGFPGLSFRGRIASISAVAQESGRTSLRRAFDVVVTLDDLDAARMRPGLSARVVVHRGIQKNVLLAPRTAIDFSGRKPRLHLVDGEEKEIVLGHCNAQDCVVVSGAGENARLARVVDIVEAGRG